MARTLGFDATVSRPPRGPASSHPATLLRETLVLTYFRFFERGGK